MLGGVVPEVHAIFEAAASNDDGAGPADLDALVEKVRPLKADISNILTHYELSTYAKRRPTRAYAGLLCACAHFCA